MCVRVYVLTLNGRGQAEDGLLFPDKANMYMCAIEDGEYKDEKIACACGRTVVWSWSFAVTHTAII